MKTICLDFETYFDDDYTLKKLTTEEYIRDPRFEAHGCAIFDPGAAPLSRSGNGMEAQWLLPKQLKELCEAWRSQQRNGTKIALLAHHAHFDGLILNEHFDFRPDFWLDTLSMGRVVFDSSVKLGLDDIAGRLGLSSKSVPYDKFKGKHWHELDVETQNEVANGAMHDCALTWQAAEIMLGGPSTGSGHPAVPYAFPPSQLPVVDIAIRMFTEPTLVGDLDLLAEAWKVEQEITRELFERLQVTDKALRSDPEFAEMLRDLGVEPELKTTAKGNDKYAFAKSDYFMQDMLYGEDEDVALLVEARLKAKSSIYRTRIERYGFMAMRGAMCIYLAYAAAHTRRFGGGDKTNFQNLPRPDEYRPQKGALRRAIKAQFYVGNTDLSQIECRILNTLAGQWDVIDKFKKRVDLYSELASAFYGSLVDKSKPAERGTGKQLELSCGYGAGGPTIVRTARAGTYGPPVYLSDTQGLAARDLYRGTHPFVVALWERAGQILWSLRDGHTMEWGPPGQTGACMTIHDHRIFHNASELWLDFSSLERFRLEDSGEEIWRHKVKNGWRKTYGARLIENVVQWLASIIINDAMKRVVAMGYKCPLTVHDNIYTLIPVNAGHIGGSQEDQFENICDQLKIICHEVARPVTWLEACPIAAEAELLTGLAMDKPLFKYVTS